MGLGSVAEPLPGHQLPFVGNVAVVAVAVLRPRLFAEDEALPGGPANDVLLGAAVGAVILRRLHHQPVVRAFVLQAARVVELTEPVHGGANDAPFLSLSTDPLVDYDDVEIGLLVPSTPGPGAEDDGAIHGVRCLLPGPGRGRWRSGRARGD